MKRLIAGAASILVASFVVLLASQDHASAANATVSLGDNFYTPNAVTVNVGDSVTWNWTGSNPHTVTASDGSFDSGNPQTSGSFSHTFNAAGTFNYSCKVHGQAMTGTITVAAAAGGTTPAAGAATTPAGGAVSTPAAGAATPSAAAPTLAAPATGTGPGSTGNDAAPLALIIGLATLGVVLAGLAIGLHRIRT